MKFAASRRHRAERQGDAGGKFLFRVGGNGGSSAAAPLLDPKMEYRCALPRVVHSL